MGRRSLRLADYLDHVLEAIDRFDRYTENLAYETFVDSDMAQDAVIRNLEIIGEACRNIEQSFPGFAAQYPDFPLKPAFEMRNVLAMLVGATGFEPATCGTQNRRATRLRHAPRAVRAPG